jgi:hypothetical protein
VTEPPISPPTPPVPIELEIAPPVVVLAIAPPTVAGEITTASVGVHTGMAQTALAPANQQAVVEAGPLRVIFAAVPGSIGPPGPGGSGAVIIGAPLTPAPNGVTDVFTLPDVYIPGSTGVFINGLRQRRSVDYTESAAAQISFTSPPGTADNLQADYTVT